MDYEEPVDNDLDSMHDTVLRYLGEDGELAIFCRGIKDVSTGSIIISRGVQNPVRIIIDYDSKTKIIDKLTIKEKRRFGYKTLQKWSKLLFGVERYERDNARLFSKMVH